jgi:hypothetical protein
MTMSDYGYKRSDYERINNDPCWWNKTTNELEARRRANYYGIHAGEVYERILEELDRESERERERSR